VVDTVNAMTFGEAFVETLAAQPGEAATADGERDEPAEDEAADHGTDISRGDAGGQAGDVDRGDAVSPRLGLFVGRLLENLEYGLR